MASSGQESESNIICADSVSQLIPLEQTIFLGSLATCLRDVLQLTF